MKVRFVYIDRQVIIKLQVIYIYTVVEIFVGEKTCHNYYFIVHN